MIQMFLRAALAFGLAIFAFSDGGEGAGVFFMIGGIFFVFYGLLMNPEESGKAWSAPKSSKPQSPVNRFVCKNCGKMRTGWYKVCPDCGATDSMEKLLQPVTPEPVSQPPVTPVPLTRQPDACIHTWVQDPNTCIARCSKCGQLKVSHNFRQIDRKCRAICTICRRGITLPHRFDEDGFCEVCGERRTSFHKLALSSGKEFLTLRRAVEIIGKEEGWLQDNLQLLDWIGTIQEYSSRELELLYHSVDTLLAHYANDPEYESVPDRLETMDVLGSLAQTLVKQQPWLIR